MPAVLCPHGHWADGRFHDHGEAAVRKEIETGAEQFPVGGRHPLQARCVQLARMGCMVFLYDMMGYADGGSFSFELAHRFAEQRPELSSPDHWGMFSAQSELRCLNILGLQTWNSIRAVDWLTSREDCDAERIGVTGASGGGTQTFMLAALDDRITAAFPAVMVSTAMQGGCTCENASYLRVNTGNIEFAALVAPRPIFMSGANDWTVEIETKGLPQLRQHFEMMGCPDHVDAKYFDFPHNFNAKSRMMMYQFFNTFLKLGQSEIVERDYIPLTREEATVFDAQHPAPATDAAAEVALLQSLDAASRARIESLYPTDADSMTEYRRVIGGALEVMVGRTLPAAGAIEYEKLTETEHDGYKSYTARIRNSAYSEDVPAAFVFPANWNSQVVLWIDGEGKSKLYSADGTLIPPVAALVAAGYAIGSVDVLYTGEFTENGQPITQARFVNNPREFAGYTAGYNHPLPAQRAHDLLSLISFAKHHQNQPSALHLVAVNGAAPYAVAAAAIAHDSLSSVVLNTEGFRFANITEIRDVNLLPGAVKYGDLPGIAALIFPTRLMLVAETPQSIGVVQKARRATGGQMQVLREWQDDTVVNWIQRPSPVKGSQAHD
ncbi:MAG: acetylxylan esterase, partial [Planctomycetaceae bacterium]|nr:acetylxylan esterase [Planctomycetaceae bacterium]